MMGKNNFVFLKKKGGGERETIYNVKKHYEKAIKNNLKKLINK